MSSKMNYIKKGLFTALVMLMAGFSQTVSATHIVGADMTFSCTAKEWFEINLTVRRDCINGDAEAVFDDPAYVGIFDAYGTPLNWLGSLGAVRMELISVEDVPLNASDCSLSSNPVCVSEARYIGRVFLPFREKGYILGYQRCCRNATLSNIIDPLESGNTSFVCITEESLNTCNSSPEFQEWPEIFSCVGEPINFNSAAIDPDGDDLIYTLYTPHLGASSTTPQPIPPAGPPYDTVEYAPGFSLNNMLGSGTPLSIDPNTGVITAVPGAVGQFLVGVLVEEWRDGEMLSKTRRNFQYNIRACSGDGDFLSFTTPDVPCGETTVQFTNTSANQNQDFVWNFNYPSTDPAFMSTEVSPTFTFPADGEYTVRLTNSAGTACNSGGGAVTTLTIGSGEEVSFELDGGRNVCLGQTLAFLNTSPNQNQDFVWNFNYPSTDPAFMSTEVSPVFTFPAPGQYTVRLTNASGNACSSSGDGGAVLVIDVPSGEQVSFNSTSTTVCRNTAIIFTNTSLNQNQDFVWNFNFPSTEPAFVSNEVSPTFVFDTPGEYRVRLTNASGNVCNEGGGFEQLITVLNSQLTSGFTYTIECTETERFVTVTSTATEADPNQTLGTTRYDVNANGVVTSHNGDNITFAIPLNEAVTITQIVGSSSGCSASSSQSVAADEGDDCSTIIVDDNPVVTLMADTICPGSSVMLVVDPNSSYTYVWSPTESLDLSDPSNPIATPTVTTTYTVTATDENGLTTTEMVTIVVEGEFLQLDIVDNNPGCGSSSANVSAVALNNPNNVDLQYDWSFDPNFGTVVASGQTVEIPLDDPTAIIYLRAGGGDFCGSNVPGLAINRGLETSVVNEGINICQTETGSVSVTSADPNDPITVVWEENPNITSDLNSSSIDIMALEGQEFIDLTYMATSMSGCTFRETIRVNVFGNGTLPNPEQDIVCGTTSVQFNIDGVYADGDVLWDFGMVNGVAITSTDANPIIDFGMSGVFTGMLSSNSSAGCSFEATPIVAQVPEVLEITGDREDTVVELCAGADSTLTFSATSNGSIIVWTDQDNNLLNAGDEVTVNSADVSMVIGTVTDAFGCTASITYTIRDYMFDIDIEGPSDASCSLDPVVLTATNNDSDANISYMWVSASGGVISGGDTSTPTIDPANSGDLVLVATNEDLGCVMEMSFPVEGSMGITSSISATETTIVSGESTTLTVDTDGEGVTYMWNDGNTEGTRTVSPTETTTYTVTVTDENGCTSMSSITITVEDPVCTDSNFFLPSAFTPNGDGNNDVLIVRSNGPVDVIDFQVLDRWGKEVFRTNDQNVGWNGFHNQTGNELAPDVYAYCLKLTCDGVESIVAGHVTLLR